MSHLKWYVNQKAFASWRQRTKTPRLECRHRTNVERLDASATVNAHGCNRASLVNVHLKNALAFKRRNLRCGRVNWGRMIQSECRNLSLCQFARIFRRAQARLDSGAVDAEHDEDKSLYHLTRIRRMFVFKGEHLFIYLRGWGENGSHVGGCICRQWDQQVKKAAVLQAVASEHCLHFIPHPSSFILYPRRRGSAEPVCFRTPLAE
jgi:hypothetical protein